MNKKQLSYQFGRVYDNTMDIVCLPIAVYLGYNSIQNLLNIKNISGFRETASSIAEGILTIIFGFEGFLHGASRLILYREIKEVRRNKKRYPLEFAEKIIIDDLDGLEELLYKTSKRELSEWGTFQNAFDDQGRAIVYKILNIKEGKKKKLIYRSYIQSHLMLNVLKAEKEGYNGCHHYHTNKGPRWFGARNYSVGFVDRNKPINWINLLTFNMSDGPEIIGFNKQFMYITKDKTKRELILATPKQIIEYLKS